MWNALQIIWPWPLYTFSSSLCKSWTGTHWILQLWTCSHKRMVLALLLNVCLGKTAALVEPGELVRNRTLRWKLRSHRRPTKPESAFNNWQLIKPFLKALQGNTYQQKFERKWKEKGSSPGYYFSYIVKCYTLGFGKRDKRLKFC